MSFKTNAAIKVVPLFKGTIPEDMKEICAELKPSNPNIDNLMQYDEGVEPFMLSVEQSLELLTKHTKFIYGDSSHHSFDVISSGITFDSYGKEPAEVIFYFQNNPFFTPLVEAVNGWVKLGALDIEFQGERLMELKGQNIPGGNQCEE